MCTEFMGNKESQQQEKTTFEKHSFEQDNLENYPQHCHFFAKEVPRKF